MHLLTVLGGCMSFPSAELELMIRVSPRPQFSTMSPGLWSRSRRLCLETVSRRTNVSSRSRLRKNCQRLGLGYLRLVPKTNFRPNCAGHSTQCERALDVVVSLCCSLILLLIILTR